MVRRFRLSFVICVLAVAGVCVLAHPANAQQLYGSIVGTVTDPSGAAVPDANVRATNTATGQVRETTTSGLGTYNLPALPAGMYDVAVSKNGFKSYESKGVSIAIDRVLRVDASLAVGATSETVQVTGEAPILQTDSAQVRDEIANTSVQNLPVPVNRNYQNLLVMVPGFSPPENQHSVAVNPSRGLVSSVNGTTRNSNNLRIEGASATNVWLPHVPAYVPGLEAIEEVSAVTNSADASEGLAGGATVNVRIKSGKNQFHGSAFEYHTDNALKARPYNFFGTTALPKPRYVNNDFGGTIGGPIIHDRLFFFGSYDGNPVHQSVSPSSDLTVPSAAMRAGDFSASPNKIYDPLTGSQTNGSNRSQFVSSSTPGSVNYNPACTNPAGCPNIIPSARLDPIALKVVALMPAPTNPALLTNNFHPVGPYNFTRHTTDGKVDWKATSKLSLSERIGWLHYDVLNAPSFGQLVGPGVSSAAGKVGNGFGDVISNTVSATYVISSHLLLDGYVAATTLKLQAQPPRIGENLGTDFLKIPGTNGPGLLYGGWPQFSVSNFTDFGNPGAGGAGGPFSDDDSQWQYAANGTWTRGSHTIRFGGEYVRQYLNRFEGTAPAGQFSFNGNATTISGGPTANLYNSFAQFLLGFPSGVVKDLIPFDNNRMIAYSHNYGFYAQDQWQAMRSLTVSYGLRWDDFPMGTRNGRGMERYNFATNQITLCGLGGTPKDCGFDPSFKEFSPRLGVAWRPTNTLVVRAGFGLNFDPYPLAFVRDLLNEYPEDLSLTLGATNNLLPAALPDGSFSTLAKGIPAIAVPDISAGVINLPKGFAMQTLPQHFKRDYVETWNLTLQKELGWGFTGQAGYVATRQVGTPNFFNLNATQTPGGGTAGQPYFARNGAAALNLILPVDHTHYDSLQTNLRRRMANGFLVNASYTFSKATALCCDVLADKNPTVQMPAYVQIAHTLAPTDRTNVFSLGTVIELPFGAGKKWLSERSVGSALLGGWQLNSLISAFSGTPFSVTASGTSLNANGSSQVADRVKTKVAILGGVGPHPYFDPFAFAPVTGARFGNSGFNSMRGPSAIFTDLSLFRNFKLTERFGLQLRAEAFNMPNTPHFSNPGTNVSNMQLNPDGSIKNLAGYDQITSTTATGRDGIDERQFRFGLRLSF